MIVVNSRFLHRLCGECVEEAMGRVEFGAEIQEKG